MGSDLFPRGHYIIPRNIFYFSQPGDATDIFWVRDAGKYPTKHKGEFPQQRNTFPRMSVVPKLRNSDLGYTSLFQSAFRLLYHLMYIQYKNSVLWPPDIKSWLIGKDPDAGKDWGQEEKRAPENEVVGWHHAHEFEQTQGDNEGQEGLACCSPWSQKKSSTTERLNNSSHLHTDTLLNVQCKNL